MLVQAILKLWRTKDMLKLNLKSRLFHEIIYLVWMVAEYYQFVLGYTVPEIPAHTDVSLYTENGITKIDCSFPKTCDRKFNLSFEEMVDVFNKHLNIYLLDANIRPYKEGHYIQDTMQAVVVSNIQEHHNNIVVTAIHVDNPLAYETARRIILAPKI